jgi:hypothetical protein
MFTSIVIFGALLFSTDKALADQPAKGSPKIYPSPAIPSSNKAPIGYYGGQLGRPLKNSDGISSEEVLKYLESIGINKEYSAVDPWRMSQIGPYTKMLAKMISLKVKILPEHLTDMNVLKAVHNITAGENYNLCGANEVFESSDKLNSDAYFRKNACGKPSTICVHSSLLLFLVDKNLGTPDYVIDSKNGKHVFNLRKRTTTGKWEFVDATNYEWAGLIMDQSKVQKFNTPVDTTSGIGNFWPLNSESVERQSPAKIYFYSIIENEAGAQPGYQDRIANSRDSGNQRAEYSNNTCQQADIDLEQNLQNSGRDPKEVEEISAEILNQGFNECDLSQILDTAFKEYSLSVKDIADILTDIDKVEWLK